MAYSPAEQVLREYRLMRRTGMAPYIAMEAIRNDRANLIAMMVAHDRLPQVLITAEWAAATNYLNSMTVRPAWWWRPGFAVTPARRAKRRPRRSNPLRQGRSTIPT